MGSLQGRLRMQPTQMRLGKGAPPGFLALHPNLPKRERRESKPTVIHLGCARRQLRRVGTAATSIGRWHMCQTCVVRLKYQRATAR